MQPCCDKQTFSPHSFSQMFLDRTTVSSSPTLVKRMQTGMVKEMHVMMMQMAMVFQMCRLVEMFKQSGYMQLHRGLVH